MDHLWQGKEMTFSLIKPINERFSFKVFILFTICIFFISISFTALFVRHQTQAQTNTLVKNGVLLSRILANNVIIGVFSENRDLLNDPVLGILKVEGILEVGVFNLEEELLIRKSNSPLSFDSMNANNGKFRKTEIPNYKEYDDWYIFRSPVIMDIGFPTDDALLFSGNAIPKKERVIGYVSIVLDKKNLKQQFRDLLEKSLIIGVAFLIIGSAAAFFVTSGVSKPLRRLTQGVRTLEKEGHVEKIPVETKDEIGKLANAFNHMSESLKKRQDALIDSESTLRFLSGQLFKAQEMERKRLSIELHDELGQGLALLKHRLRFIEKKLPMGQESVSHECEDTISDINRIIENVRRLSKDLSPSILEDLGLSAAIRWLIESFQKQHDVEIILEMDNIDHLFNEEAQTNIYRIFQEILNNIGKHANARKVMFIIKIEDDQVFFKVEDNGKGFDLKEAKTLNFEARGIGLAAMDERAHMLRALFDINSRPGKGTRIELKIPI